MFKRVGCGECKACQLTVDCGTCPGCTMRVSRPGASQLPGSQCVQRRCLKIVKKSFGCGVCSGCKVKEDCGTCCICERRGKPDLKRQWKCLQRRCLKKRIKKKPRGLPTRKLPGRRRRVLMPPPPPQAYGPFGTTKVPSPNGSLVVPSRCCWRRPDFQEEGGGLRGRGEKAGRSPEKGVPVMMEEFDPGFAVPSGTDLVILQEQEGREGVSIVVPSTKPRSSRFSSPSCIVIEEFACPNFGVFVSTPLIKQEVESYGDQAFGPVFPPPSDFSPGLPITLDVDKTQLPLSVKQEETWGEEEVEEVEEEEEVEEVEEEEEEEEEEDEDAKADTPVIMEIYSLSGAAPIRAGSWSGVLDSVLQEFLGELNELPLPAHWEVLPPRGPDLCITQRSPLSTMASAVIHIQPGLYFHVVIQDVPVPANHELYTAHPLRLTTVDEVVELICNLEAYHVCPGFPGIGRQGSRSPDCDVLVYEGRCQACCLPPCPLKEWH
ncbi:methyl-CpG-binding domain protein 1 isoform X3 [Sarcophilus harrisii]|nr:methyl-CpG-binding domain protein 1 isoform X3 [Sarcophilus harrisii]